MKSSYRKKGLAIAGLLLGVGLLLIGSAVIIRPEIVRFNFDSFWSINGVKYSRSYVQTIGQTELVRS